MTLLAKTLLQNDCNQCYCLFKFNHVAYVNTK